MLLTISRQAWYIQLYFACAHIINTLHKSESVDTEKGPSELCTLIQVYVRALWHVVFIVLAVLFYLALIVIVATALGFGVFDSGKIGTAVRMTALVLASVVGAAIAIWVVCTIGTWVCNKIWSAFPDTWSVKKWHRTQKKRSTPQPKKVPVHQPSFLDVAGAWLESRKGKYCARIEVV